MRKSAASVLAFAVLFSSVSLPPLHAEEVSPSPEVTVAPEATPTPEASPEITSSPTAIPSPEVSPTTSPIAEPSTSVSPEATPSKSATPAASVSPTVSLTLEETPTPLPSASPEESIAATPEPTPTTTDPEPTPSESPLQILETTPEANPKTEQTPESAQSAPAVSESPAPTPLVIQQASLQAEPTVIDENTCTFSRTVSPPSPNFFSHKGGAWTDPTVWGYEAGTGSYPQAGDIVRVDHNIGLDIRGSQTNDIGGLIVGSNGRLYNSYYSQSLNISGPVWNDGTIEVPQYDIYGLGLSISGDIVNNGTWNISGVNLTGTNARTIVPNSPMQHNTAQLSIVDDLTLEGCFSLPDVVRMSGQTLTIKEGSRISLGHLEGIGNLTGGGSLHLNNNPYIDADFSGDIRYLVFDRSGSTFHRGSFAAEDIIFAGSGSRLIRGQFTLTGTVTVRSGVAFVGDDTTAVVTIYGDLHNAGEFRDENSGGRHFQLNVNGDFFHSGILGRSGGENLFSTYLAGNVFTIDGGSYPGVKTYALHNNDPAATLYSVRYVNTESGQVYTPTTLGTIDLQPWRGGTFFWRIRPHYDDTVGAWSAIRTINILPQEVPPSLLVEDENDVEVAHEGLLDFRGTVLGSSVGKTIRLTNFGGDTLDLIDGAEVRIEGVDAADFALGTIQVSAIAPEDSTAVRVEFRPQTLGFKHAELVIRSDDPHRPEYRIALAGAGFSEEATIHSTKAGGVWNNPATWLEGRRPTTDDIVEILGPVTTYSEDPTIAGLLVAETGSLRGGSNSRSEFTINGPFLNDGLVSDYVPNDQYNRTLAITAYGDVINHGQLITNGISIYGDSDREISGEFPLTVSIGGSFAMTGSPIFSGNGFNTGNITNLITTTEESVITISSSGVGNVNFGENATLILDGTQDISGDIFAKHVTFQNGTKTIYDETHIYGNVHILSGTKIWDRTKSGGVRGYLYIHGDLDNEGNITDNPGDYYASLRSMNVYVSGNINSVTLNNNSAQIFWDPSVNKSGTYQLAFTSDEMQANSASPETWPEIFARNSSYHSVKERINDGNSWYWTVREQIDGEWSEWQWIRSINAPESAPRLVFSLEDEFVNDSGERHGIDKPNAKATANEEEITFKVVYTDKKGAMPDTVTVVENFYPDGSTEIISNVYTMQKDSEAKNEALINGDTSDGEQYSFAGVFPKGVHKYKFFAKDADGNLLASHPSDQLEFQAGYSNVIFFPGILGSRLYKSGEKLWEPSSLSIDNDIEALFLDNVGQSITDGIYTKDAVDETAGVNTYKLFLQQLEQWKTNNLYNDYEVFPYDWRLPFDQNLISSSKRDFKIYFDRADAYFYNRAEELAKSAANGKVIVVGHSMGGFMAKSLIDGLPDQNIVDSLILVASPQIGTPQAIASLLHGEDQYLHTFFDNDYDPEDWNWDFYKLTDSLLSRELVKNMVTSYVLLPSNKYFDYVYDVYSAGAGLNHSPVITFDDSLRHIDDPDVYKFLDYYVDQKSINHINVYSAYQDFLSGKEGRAQSPNILGGAIRPLVVNQSVLDQANNIQDYMDNWQPPTHIKTFQIAGWGLHTIKGIKYYGKNVGGESDSKYILDIKPEFTIDGDKTVVLPSAIALEKPGIDNPYDFVKTPNLETYFVNIKGYNKRGFLNTTVNNRRHSSILEINPLRNLIADMISHEDIVLDNNPNLEFISTSLPTTNDKYIRLAIHSPVAIDIYDVNGNHTGLTYDPEKPEKQVSIAEEIPNSYYMQFGEGKYLGIPADSNYTIKLQGLDEGTFTFEMTEVLGDEELQTKTYTDIPTNPNMKGVVTLSDLDSATNLQLDNDGDGVFEKELIPDEEQTSATLFCPDFEQTVTYVPTAVAPNDCGDIATEANQLKLVDSQCNPLENVRVNLRRENGSYITYKKTDASGLADFSDADLTSNPSLFEVDYNGAKYQTAVDTYNSGTSVQTLPYRITLKDSACEPIENARINLRRENDSYVTYTRTAADGTATFETLPEASMKFEADYNGGKLSTEAHTAETEVLLGTENFALLLTDSKENPIENARINLRRENDSYVTYARTDATGVAGFEVLPNVALKHEVDYNGAKYMTTASATHEQQQLQTLTFGVHLTDSTANPLENVRVNLRRGNDSYITYTRTDASGYGVFEVLPNAEMKLEVDYNGAKYLTAAVTVTESSIEEMQLDATVEVSTNAIVAVVTDSIGNPIENARVNLRRENGSYVTYSRTNSGGIASFETVPGAIMKLELDYNGAKYMTEAVTVNGNTEVAIITLPYTLQLTDSNGDPLANVRINLRRSNDSYVTYTRTDEFGRATFEVVPNAEMKFEVDYNGEKYSTETMVITEETQIDVQTLPYILNLEDSNGDPLANVRINLRRSNDSYVTYTRTDEAGIAAFEVVTNAEMKFEVDYNGGKFSTDAAIVTESTQPVTVETLPLNVFLTVEGNPLANQRVDLLRANDSYITYAKTDEAGMAVFEVLPEAEHKVRVKYNEETWVSEEVSGGDSVEQGF